MDNESIFKDTKPNTNKKKKQQKNNSNKKNSKKKRNVDYSAIQNIYTKQNKKHCKYYINGKCAKFNKIQCRNVPYCEFYVKKQNKQNKKKKPIQLLFDVRNKNIALNLYISTTQQEFKTYQNCYIFHYNQQEPIEASIYLLSIKKDTKK